MNIVGNFETSKYYVPGLGYSTSSNGGTGGGPNFPANPSVYSSTFFGDNIKALFPIMPSINSFGRSKRFKKLPCAKRFIKCRSKRGTKRGRKCGVKFQKCRVKSGRSRRK